MSKSIDIYEVEYSVSPQGEDCWEVTEREGEFFKGDFNTVEEAISYVLNQFKGEELNLNIKSLEWYHAQEEEDIEEEVMNTQEVLTISTFCQDKACDKDIEVSAILYMPTNRVIYVCSYCGVEQGQDNWLGGAGV